MLLYIVKQLHSFIPDAELEDSIRKYNPIPSNLPLSAPLDEFLKGVFLNICNCRRISLTKNAAKVIKFSGSSVNNLAEN